MSRMRRTGPTARTTLVALAVALVAGPAATFLPAARAADGLKAVPVPPAAPAGLPDDGPPALYAPEPVLPTADGWPGPDAFPRTSGTGRLQGGGLFWTDFLYDDHGAIG